MSLIRSNHGLMFKISNHGDKNGPSFDLFADAQEGTTFSVIDFDRLKSLSHFFNLIFHLINIHLSPFQLHIIIESILTFFNMFPEFFHPSNLNFNCINNFSTASSLTFREFKHFLIITELVELLPKLFHILFS